MIRVHLKPALGWLLLLLLVVPVVTGCCSNKPRAYDVVVSLDQESWNPTSGGVIPSLEVDLVGINPTEKPTWEGYSVTKYFSPNNALRRDADRVTQTFTNEDRQPKTISKKDPVWKEQWIGKKGKGAEWLLVMVNLPGVDSEAAGGSDPRRLILPLACKKWVSGTKKLEVVIKSSQVICKTPLRPEKNK